jgi:hypothetical protein
MKGGFVLSAGGGRRTETLPNLYVLPAWSVHMMKVQGYCSNLTHQGAAQEHRRYDCKSNLSLQFIPPYGS